MASPPNPRRADEAASGRREPAYSLLTDRDRLIVQRRWPWPFDGRGLLILDGTATLGLRRGYSGQGQPRLGHTWVGRC
jgi:hypothetical protein